MGHTGTLDPGAAGVLPICIGKATKIVDYLTAQDKKYICEICFGETTDTYDKYGNVVRRYEKDFTLDYQKLNQIIKSKFIGEIEQVPPAYSAIKINGMRAYDLARKGHEFEIPKRKVIIYNIDIIDVYSKRALLEVHCSKGTYIRSLCYDLGECLGYGAYMGFLLRTQTGKFKLDDSYVLDEINKENINNIMLTVDKLLDYDSLKLDINESKKFCNGVILSKRHKDGMYKIYNYKSEFLGIGNINNNKLKPEKIFV
ncbi:tRNA pseudouridine(55) synthase TruB [Thermobrachium celere]|uniref:tRNA pseudouridine(55) synthase TruB n=1 Tax=Thermobrachium celere TaxID=53422 RepID=UPI0027DDEFAA|nr:tRNA pseudouridine(55) synthase TruB [Thermobrachium celere]